MANKSDSLAIKARGLTKIYPSGDGVHDLNLEIPPGSIFGFVGPSGSGKTTTVRMLTGVELPTSGDLSVLGVNPKDFTSEDRARIGYLPQLSVLFPTLSVAQNLKFFTALQGVSGKRHRQRLKEVMEFVGLDGHQKKKVSQISGGMQRRLSLAYALAHEPELVFLDEPTAGVDPVLRKSFWDRFATIRDQGRTLFVTTQYVGEAAYCDYVGVLSDGELLLVDTPEGIRRYAYGGDVLDVELGTTANDQLVRNLGETVGAKSSKATSLRKVRLVVDEAGTALPAAASWLESQGIEVLHAEEFQPPFDDVFVQIIEQDRDERNESRPVNADA